MSDQPHLTSEKKLKSERRRFIGWMSRYWAGINLDYMEDIDEFRSATAQVGWEIWKKFNGVRS